MTGQIWHCYRENGQIQEPTTKQDNSKELVYSCVSPSKYWAERNFEMFQKMQEMRGNIKSN